MKKKRYFASKQQAEEILKVWRSWPAAVEGNKKMWRQLQKYLEDPDGYF